MFAPYEPRSGNRPPRPAAGEGLLIRTGAPGDAEPIARLTAERSGDDVGKHLAKLTSELTHPEFGDKRLLLVAEVGGRVVGFGRVHFRVPGADEPANAAPRGWYLGGLIVAPSHRRRGIGRELTRRRLDWLRGRGACAAWFFANAQNLASIDLHAAFDFREVTRDFSYPGATFSGGGVGILYRAELDDPSPTRFSV